MAEVVDAAAGWRAAGDADRPRRLGQDPARGRGGGRARAGVQERRLLGRRWPPCATRRSSPRRSPRRWAPRTAWPSTSASASCCCCSTTSSRWSRRRRSSARCSRPARTCASAGDEPGAAARRGRGRVPGAAAGRSRGGRALLRPRPGSSPTRRSRELCRRLDNLPLAIELAAARTSVLSPAQILERSRSGSICSRAAVTPTRASRRCGPRSSGATTSSTEEEQRLFARLAVFAGGCTLEAAEEVCDADLDTLQSLVDKSLCATRTSASGCSRRSASSRSSGSRSPARPTELRRRHAAYFLELAELAKPELRGGELVDLVRPVRSGARQHPCRPRRGARARIRRHRASALRRNLRSSG